MAKRNDTRAGPVPARTTRQERFLTVALYPEPHPRLPWIRLRGLWLEEAGFTPRTRVRVRIMRGCLVITTD
jgi:hypothetical protein